MPTFELGVSDEVWASLYKDWQDGPKNKDDDKETKVEYPLDSFKFEEQVITNASIRLRGNPDQWQAQKKLQLEISFNAYDKEGRFHGLRNILFDAATYNRSFLRDRLALSVMRDVGLPAPCANNARVVINGNYYGLFTSIEKVDKSFLKRNFENPDGDLWKRAGWELKTNEDTSNKTRLNALRSAASVEELDKYLDLDEAILEWATEAVLPTGDGAWAGGYNFYLYDDPGSEFILIPWDLDQAFTFLTPDVDPVTYLKPDDHGRPFYNLALKDKDLYAKYIMALQHVLQTAYQVPVLHQRIDTWSAQIQQAAAEDPNKPFTTKQHKEQVAEKKIFVEERAKFLESYLCKEMKALGMEDMMCDSP